MMLDLENATLIVGAALETVRLRVGWSASPDGTGGVATLRSGLIRESESRDCEALLREGVTLGGEVHGVMHSAIEITGRALEVPARHWNGPRIA